MKQTHERRWRLLTCLRHSRRRTSRFNFRTGGATVEMALVAPFIFMLIFASVEFSRMMMVRQALTNAAREGCRHVCLITTLDSDTAEPIARTMLQGVISNAAGTEVIRVNTSPAYSGLPNSETIPDAGTIITTYVEVNCSDVSWLPAFFTSGATIRGTSSMIRE